MTGMAAPGRSPEIPEEADLYGWLVGSWELDVRHYRVDVSGRGIKGEAHFGWILEGRAVQDVWIMRAGEVGHMHGTTLRVWDPEIQAWRITWINPVPVYRDELIGRRSGQDIVQVGTHQDGTPIRWTGEALAADGENWRLEGEFLARRVR